MKSLSRWVLISMCGLAISACETVSRTTTNDGSVDIPAFRLPLSDYLSDATKKVLTNERGALDILDECPPANNPMDVPLNELSAWRDCRAKVFKKTAFYRDLIARYGDVSVTEKNIAGVRNEIFVPNAGVARENKHRVLIQLHGGAEIYGSRIFTHTGSVPVSSIGRYKVIAVDYPLYPEASHRERTSAFVSVYKALLNDYRPENIGVYGCSAGGIMTSQMVPSLLREGLPVPGAVGIFGGDGSVVTTVGDSFYWGIFSSSKTEQYPVQHRQTIVQSKAAARARGEISPVYKGFSPEDPRVNPLKSPEILKQFPPSLLLYGLRDFNVSGGVALHSVLIKHGVEADLHVWEGQEHCFQGNPNIPESKDANQVVVNFFDKHLGRDPL